MSVQIAGPIGPFLDSVQQRQVPAEVVATFDFTPSGPVADAAALEQRVQAQVLRAVREVTAARMAAGTLEFRNLSEGADLIIPDVVAASGLAQEGVRVDNLVMTFGVDGRPPKRWNLSAPKAAASAAPAVPNVGVRLHVGGLNINASSRGGVDASGLAGQVGDRIKSTLVWYAVSGLLVLLIVGGVGLYVRHTISQSLHGGSGAPSAAKGAVKCPISCGGRQSVTSTCVTANLPGTAFTALGACSLTLVNVDITAATGIEAAGSATVVVRGGKITGSTHAVSALGAAKVTFSGTKVTGKTQALGAAKITGQ